MNLKVNRNSAGEITEQTKFLLRNWKLFVRLSPCRIEPSSYRLLAVTGKYDLISKHGKNICAVLTNVD